MNASATPVFDASNVYVAARVSLVGAGGGGGGGTQWRALAIRRSDGGVAWSALIPAPALDSFSSITVDATRNIVLVPSGRVLICFDAATGVERWRATLVRSIVNASATIATQVAGRGRVFITDYDGFGTGASLVCINIDPFTASNPFQPGAIVWSVPIGGASGATPAYLVTNQGGVGLVYVATLGDPGVTGGSVLAYPADASVAPAPAFIASNLITEGFFGGVSVVPAMRAGQGPRVYAASYAFFGDIDAGNLIALDGSTGTIYWSVPSNRSASTPVALGNGRIALSSGIQGFGSVPSVGLFVDRGDSALQLWDSAIDSWTDLDSDLSLDLGEYLRAGLWSYQPVVSRDANQLCVGVPSTSTTVGAFGAELATLDVALGPRDRNFFTSITGVSGSPAIAHRAWYAIGAGTNGGSVMSAFASMRPDVNSDGRVSVDDLAAFERGVVSVSARDINGDLSVTLADRTALMMILRRNEASRSASRRP